MTMILSAKKFKSCAKYLSVLQKRIYETIWYYYAIIIKLFQSTRKRHVFYHIC